MLTLRQMRRNAAGIAILVLVPTGLIVWLWSSSGAAAAPTVPTGASFSLTVARVRGEAAASSVAGRLTAAGYPAFTRVLSGGQAHQIVVGPYVSIDEVERAQQRLRAQGLGARMLVDESVRLAPTSANLNPVERAGDGPRIVLVGAAGRLSLVFEMDGRPEQARATRAEGSLVEVEIGPVTAVSPQLWNGPASAGLVNHVAIGEVERDGRRFLQARLALANPVGTRVRTLGHRVYVDLWEMDGETTRGANPSGSPREPGRPAPPTPQVMAVEEALPAVLTPDEYQDLVAPAVARLQAIEPFVAAAVTAPSADVLAALAGSLADLHAVLAAMEPPAESTASHAALVKNADGLLRIVRAATPLPPPSTPPQP